MTTDEAKALVSFKNRCQCGGFAWAMNGRPESQPHMDWCPQRQEYAEWYRAMKSTPPAKDALGNSQEGAAK